MIVVVPSYLIFDDFFFERKKNSFDCLHACMYAHTRFLIIFCRRPAMQCALSTTSHFISFSVEWKDVTKRCNQNDIPFHLLYTSSPFTPRETSTRTVYFLQFCCSLRAREHFFSNNTHLCSATKRNVPQRGDHNKTNKESQSTSNNINSSKELKSSKTTKIVDQKWKRGKERRASEEEWMRRENLR